MTAVPQLRFSKAAHYAFFYEDTHLMLIDFERDARRMVFLIHDSADDVIDLSFPGDLYETQIHDAIDRLFFVELQEEHKDPLKLVMGAYFPVEDEYYGAYYPRGGDEQEIYFLRVIGEGESATLEAVETPDGHARVAQAFADRYADVFTLNDTPLTE